MPSKIPRPRAIVAAIALAATAGGVAIRFLLDRTPLWLDEAQTAAIVDLDLGDMFDALREDGHPPAYYVLLKVWSGVFGTTDAALRSLSAVLSLVALALIGHLARRRLGFDGGVIALALAACSPFAVRYATEVRMYSLVMVLAAAAWLCWELAFEPASSRARRLAATGGFGVCTGVLVLTHYWTVFPLATAALILVHRARNRDGRIAGPARGLLVAGAVGALAFVPWIPTFVHQMGHTGTPWAAAPNPGAALVTGFSDLAGGRFRTTALALMIVLAGLLVLGLAARARGPRELSIELTGVPETKPIAAFVIATLALAMAVIVVTDSAFASRYLAIVVPAVIVVAARGVQQFEDVLIRSGVLIVACGLGLATSWAEVSDDRSQGQDAALAIAGDLGPGDVVVACPDQIGPATERYLTGTTVLAYPTLEPADRVDWTDYEDRNAAADPTTVADQIVERAGSGRVWLVWKDGYRTFADQCERLLAALSDRIGSSRPVLSPRPDVFEPMAVTTFDRIAP